MHSVKEIEDSYSRQYDIKFKYIDAAIVFLNNNLIQTTSFKSKMKYLKAKRKPILYVSFSNDLNDFNDEVILLNKPLDLNTDNTILKSFQSLLFSVLGIQKFYFKEKFDDLTFNFESFHIKINAGSDEEMNNDGIYILKADGLLKIMNLNKIIGKIALDRIINPYCWIDHLKQVFVISYDHDNKKEYGSLYNKSGKFVKKVDLSKRFRISASSNLVYSSTNQYTYLVNENDSLQENNASIYAYDQNLNYRMNGRIQASKIFIYNQHIYSFTYCSLHQICIYDFLFHLVAVVRNPNYINNFIHISFYQPKSIEILPWSTFVLIDNYVFNTKTFSFIGTINPRYRKELKAVSDGTIYHSFYRNQQLILKYNLKKLQNFIINPEYICKINPFKPHLYKNPYLLPCGNSICFNCVFQNFNTYLNEFMCNFETCQQVHEFKEIKKNLELNEMISNSVQEILRSMIDKGERFLETISNIPFKN